MSDRFRSHPFARIILPCLILATLCFVSLGRAAELRTLTGHVPSAAARLPSLGRLEASNTLRLTLSLPLHHQAELTQLLNRLYDPTSPDYHKYLAPGQFAERFGPTRGEYQQVLRFAQSNGLDIARTHDSRMMLDVRGSAAAIEKTFHVTLHKYQHPTEHRQFYAPDVEPTVDATLPIQHVHGLNNYALLRPMAHLKSSAANPTAAAGSGPGGFFIGKDFLNAYGPGVTLNGAGQMVGLFEADGFYTNDISRYEAQAGLVNVPLITVTNDGFSGAPGADNFEVALDIEMAIAMAPGLNAVVVFEGPDDVGDWLDTLDSMASSNQILQFSSSWGYTSGTDPNTDFDAVFQRMAAQGQSFFQASGDGDAWVNPVWVPADSPYVTSVGGTLLSMNGSGASYNSESVWNSGNLGVGDAWPANGNGWWGSGGGVSTVYSIPLWQQGLGMSANNGSTNMRNIPDVAMAADDIWITYSSNMTGSVMGTSCAAPLWAGFLALVNQQAAANADPPPGFINSAVYAIGQGVTYGNCFHDIKTGNNTNAQSAGLYQAVTGYDLCCGWGTPAGSNLINALAPLDALSISPPTGFISSGGRHGPYTVTDESFVLTNTGTNTLTWSAVSGVPWLTVFPGAGTLVPGGPASTVTVSLNATASNEVVGVYTGEVEFTNRNDSVVQERAFTLDVINPPAITLAPGNQIVLTGTTATFTAGASGGAPLFYQWQHDGTNLTDNASISGSTNSALALAGVTMPEAGSYSIIVSNAAGTTNSAPAILTVVASPQLVQNGGFETGNFSGWTLLGSAPGNVDVTIGNDYVHSGQYGVQAGPGGSLGFLSQTLATMPGQLYLVSCWFDSPGNDATPNEFSISWNGTNLYDQTDLPGFGWTNFVFTATATVTNTVLQFGFRNDPAYFGFDDASVLPLRAQLQNPAAADGLFTFDWIALQGHQYQVQSTTNVAQTNWINVGGPVTAGSFLLTSTNALTTNRQVFYRVILLQ